MIAPQAAAASCHSPAYTHSAPQIYRRQVFKGGLSRTGMEEGEQFRYFAQEVRAEGMCIVLIIT